jgi:hypothetical protein
MVCLVVEPHTGTCALCRLSQTVSLEATGAKRFAAAVSNVRINDKTFYKVLSTPPLKA